MANTEMTPQQKGVELVKLLTDSQNNLLKLENLRVIHPATDTRLQITDPANQTYDCSAFVSMSQELVSSLPGSHLSPEQLLQVLNPDQVREREQKANSLINGVPEQASGMVFQHEESLGETNGKFALNVYSGSANKHSVRLSELAKEAFDYKIKIESLPLSSEDEKKELTQRYDQVRVEYQKVLVDVMRPIHNNQTQQSSLEQKPELVIEEDCIASADSLVGVMKYLTDSQSSLIEGRKIKINIAIATAQAVLVLRKFALDNGLDLEINAGYLGWGLTAGTKTQGTETRAHANYIQWTPDVVEKITDSSLKARINALKDGDNLPQVVGDMGDMVRVLPGEHNETCPWNLKRIEKIGEEGAVEIVNKPDNVAVFAAKRMWDSERGYGVAINKVSLAENPAQVQSITMVLANGGYGMWAIMQGALEED